MGLRERLQMTLPLVGEADPHDPLVPVAVLASDKPCLDGPVDELHRAVMPQEQVTGDLTEAWRVALPPYRQEELVLGRRHACLPGPILAPPQEAAQAVAELQEPGVIGIVEVHIVIRDYRLAICI